VRMPAKSETRRTSPSEVQFTNPQGRPRGVQSLNERAGKLQPVRASPAFHSKAGLRLLPRTPLQPMQPTRRPLRVALRAGCANLPVPEEKELSYPQERTPLRESSASSSSYCDEDGENRDMQCHRVLNEPASSKPESLLKLDLSHVFTRMATGLLTEGAEASWRAPDTPRGRPPVAWWNSEVVAPASARGHAKSSADLIAGTHREARSLYVLELVTPRTAVSLRAGVEDKDLQSPLQILRPASSRRKQEGDGRASLSSISISSDEDDIRNRLNEEIDRRTSARQTEEAQAEGEAVTCTEATMCKEFTTTLPTPARSLKLNPFQDR